MLSQERQKSGLLLLDAVKCLIDLRSSQRTNDVGKIAAALSATREQLSLEESVCSQEQLKRYLLLHYNFTRNFNQGEKQN